MNKRLIYNIICYVTLLAMIIYSIYKIVDLSLKLNKSFEVNFVIGIVIFAIVIILSIATTIKLLRDDIYRNHFFKKK